MVKDAKITDEYFKSNQIKMSDIKADDILITDAGFTCLNNRQECIVFNDPDQGLFICCDNGKHLLEGQLTQENIITGLILKPTH